jgi:hypothetical protein
MVITVAFSITPPCAILAASCLFLSVATTPAAELHVGEGQTYARPSLAASAAKDGDTVVIHAGVYLRDTCVWRANNLTLKGDGPSETILNAQGTACLGKAIWILQGTNTTVEGVSFRGASCPDRNGAGIRLEADGLIARDCRFERNENGILCGALPNCSVTFVRCSFSDNGAGDGFSHNLYIGAIRKLALEQCVSRYADKGHCLKSRAFETVLERCTFDDMPAGRSSYLADFPDGGRVTVRSCTFAQSPDATNGTMLSYGEENPSRPGNALTIEDCDFKDCRKSGSFLSVTPKSLAPSLSGNRFTKP